MAGRAAWGLAGAMMLTLLAQFNLQTPPSGYGPIVVVIAIAVALAATIVLLAHLLPKPGRHGPVKDSVYESGMPPIGDARGRFNVRFYLVAMLFLLFDVELIFMYPWALVFFRAPADPALSPDWAAAVVGGTGLRTFLFAEMAIFIGVLLVGYVYAWRKGIFRWD